MQQRISIVTLGVADLDVSRDFYEGTLGWRPAFTGEIVFYNMGGWAFALYPHDKLAEDMNAKPGRPARDAAGAFTLAYNTASEAEVDDLFAHLKVKGARILKEPEKVFWGGYSGYFADPDGHAWEIAHNPYWTVDEDGIPRPQT